MSDILDEIIKRNINVHRDSLLPLLQEIQNELGYLSDESINRIGQLTGMPTSKIYGVATFYDQFRFNPKGRFHIRVCHGTACHVNESMNIIRELERILKIKQGQTTRDGMYSLEVVNCMGACAVAPVMNINGKYVPAAEVHKIKDIVEGLVSNSSVYENCQ
jgi:NADH:ubiquinone oxidoreductase subunit E